MSDSLSHLFSHIQNGQRGHILTIESVQTKLVIAVLNILQDHGYIRGYRFHPTASNKLQILLKYKNQKPVINKIIRISKPSKRVYISINQLRGAGVPPKERISSPAPKPNARLVNSAAQTMLKGKTSNFIASVSRPLQVVKPHDVGVANHAAPKAKPMDHAGHCASSGHQLNSLFFMQGIFILSTSKGI